MKDISRRNFLKIGAGSCVALAATPWGGCDQDSDEHRATVYAVLGDELSELYTMGRQATEALGISGRALAGATVLIKPNLVAVGMDYLGVGYNPSTGECTKPELVLGVAEQCLAAGAANVTIAEAAQAMEWDWSLITLLPGNDVGGATNMQAGVDRLASIYGSDRVALSCLNQADEWIYVPSSSGHEYVAEGIPVAQLFAEVDHVISVPCLKTHQWAKITGSLKNYVGVTSRNLVGNGFSRCKLHLAYAQEHCHGVDEAGIGGSAVDIHNYRKQEGREDFVVFDASIGLEGNGPHIAPVTDGRTIHLNERNTAEKYFLLASNDLVAADCVAARLMSIAPEEVKTLQMATNLRLGATAESRIRLEGASVEELRVADWLQPTIESEDFFNTVCDNSDGK